MFLSGSKVKCFELSQGPDTATLNKNSSSVVKLRWQFTSGLCQFSQFSFAYFDVSTEQEQTTWYTGHTVNHDYTVDPSTWQVGGPSQREYSYTYLFYICTQCSDYWYSMYNSSICCVLNIRYSMWATWNDQARCPACFRFIAV